jgi:hypothetical protein
MNAVCYKKEELTALLLEHIIRGDRSDGIPNIHSDDNCFVINKRQTPITSKTMTKVFDNPAEYCDSNGIADNYKRNQVLIDFQHIPDELYERIIDAYKYRKQYNLLKR